MALLTAVGIASGCAAPASEGSGENTLTVALTGTPPTLDPHRTSAFLTQHVAWHVYEGLWTIDSAYQAKPMLAESGEFDAETNVFTITLRDGVQFHDGSTLDSADVTASLERWRRAASYGALFSDLVAEINAPSDKVVELTLTQPSPVIEQLLAFPNQQAAIMPSEVVEAAGDGAIEEPVGTGPYRFVEQVPDQHIRLERFADYAARNEPADGMAGRREAIAETLEFRPVPEVSVRRDSVITGEVQVAEGLSPDMISSLESSEEVEPAIVQPSGWPMAVFDKTEAPFDNVTARRAFMAALDMEPVMQGGLGSGQFYRLQPGVLFPEQERWASEAGSEIYNQQDVDEARRLLDESGYDGRPLTWLTTREYAYMYGAAAVAEQQLEAVGFDINLEVVDYATIVDLRTRPEEYDIFSGGTTFTADPGIWPCWDETWPGFWVDPHKDELVQRLNTTMNLEERQAVWDELQTYFYEQVPMVKFGDNFDLTAYGVDVKGFVGTPFPAYWGVSVGSGA